jgi:DNA-binding SARP family transcriptional activator
MSELLRITMLGPLTVRRGEQPLPEPAWRSRQERRLLALLLTVRGPTLSAEQIIERLWPDADPAAAGVTLRSAISSLRRTLEPDLPARAASRYILTRHAGYAWNTASGAWIDVEEFLACLAELREAHPGAARPAPDPARLERAIQLYQGDYLADEPGAPWAEGERERLREALLQAAHALAGLYLDRGDPAAAAEVARRGLARDGLHEPLYRALMLAQARAGDTAGALRTYERCRAALIEALGGEPSAQTRDLHGAILRGELPAPPPRAPAPPAAPPPSAPPERPRLIGRERELAALQVWIDSWTRGHGGTITIVGEAGIGKTRLAEEVRQIALARGGLALTLRATALERDLPFAPLSEALRPLLRAAPSEALRQMPRAALAEVAELLPLLRERLPDLGPLPALPPAERQNRQLNGLIDLARAIAATQPLLLICDDAQWADSATLIALARLARLAPRRPILILLAYRSEDLADNPALHTLLRSLGREMLLRPLLLPRFERQEVVRFLADLAQTSPAPVERLAERLTARTGGNPLFLTVAVQALLEIHHAPSLAALLPGLDDTSVLPDLSGAPAIRDLVLARVAGLPAPARDLLDALALLNRPASLDLAELLGGPEALEAAQTLLERQFLAERESRLIFSHDLVRSTVAAALSAPQRRRLHRQIADALLRLHGDEPRRAAELALHLRSSGRGAEAELLRAAVSAGDHARSSYAYQQALQHYETALETARRLPQAHAEVRRAFAGLLLTYEALLDWDGISATARRYERWAAGGSLPPIITTRRLVLLRALMGDLAGATELSQQDGAGQQSPILADMLERTATILRPVDPRHAPEALLFSPPPPLPGRPADELPALLGADEAAQALFQVGWAALNQGLVREAGPCLQRAYDLAVETSQAAAAVASALQLAHLHTLRGQPAATEQWLARSLELAQAASEAVWASLWPRLHQGFLWLHDDQLDLALARFAEMDAQLAALPTFQSHRASARVGLGLVALARGKTAEAAPPLEEAAASPHLYGFVYAAAQHGLARLAALRGDLPAARAVLRHALNYSARRSLLPEYARTAIELARIERDYGRPANALPTLRDAAAHAAAYGLAPLAQAAQALLARLGDEGRDILK